MKTTTARSGLGGQSVYKAKSARDKWRRVSKCRACTTSCQLCPNSKLQGLHQAACGRECKQNKMRCSIIVGLLMHYGHNRKNAVQLEEGTPRILATPTNFLRTMGCTYFLRTLQRPPTPAQALLVLALRFVLK